MIEWEDYVDITDETAVYPGAFYDRKNPMFHVMGIMYAALGLNGEAGEVADVVKKQFRNNGDLHSGDLKFCNKMMEEMGDVMWYMARLCRALNLDMQEILEMNVIKLKERKEQDALKIHD